MKKRVRIYKAGGEQGMVINPLSKWMMQMGGSAQQSQFSDEQLFRFIMNKFAEEADPEDIHNELISQNVDPQKSQQLISVAMERIEEEQDLNKAALQNSSEADELMQEEMLRQQAADEELASKQRMQSLYADDYEMDESVYNDAEDQLLMRDGGTLPSKKSFVNNVFKALKKQSGGSNRVDSTGGDKRDELNSAFINSVRNSSEEALIKKEIENYYDQSLLPEAQRGREMRRAERQQRQIYKNLNRMIGQVPMGYFNRGYQQVPNVMNFMGIPQMMPINMQQFSQGPGIRMANIDVRRTGLFGRPKEYSITFGYDMFNQPQLQEDYVKQEIRNAQEANKNNPAAVTEDETNVDNTESKETPGNTPDKGSSSGTSSNNNDVKDETVTKTKTDKTSNKGLKAVDHAEYDYYDKNLRQNKYTGIFQVKAQDTGKWIDTPVRPESIVSQNTTYPTIRSGAYTDFSGDPTTSFEIGEYQQVGPNSRLNPFTNQIETYNPNTGLWQGSVNIREPEKNMFKSPMLEGLYQRYKQGTPTQQQSGGAINPFDENYGNPDLYKFIYGGNEYQNGNEVKRYTEILDKDGKVITKLPEEEALRFLETNRGMGYMGRDVKANVSSTTTQNTQNTQRQNTYQVNPYQMNPYGGIGPIYPPLFGARRFRPGAYNPAITYAGSWTQQRGLPYDPLTGKPYSGSGFGQLPLSRIDVKGRKATYTFGQPAQPGQPQTYKKDGVSGVILPSQTTSNEQTTSEQGLIPGEKIKGQALWKYPKISEYEPMNTEFKSTGESNVFFNDDTYRGRVYDIDAEGNSLTTYDRGQRIIKRNRTQRGFQYGGIPYAQSGMEQDEVIRMNTLRPQDVLQPGITSETQDVLNPFAGEQYSIDTKQKNMYTVDFPQALNQFNTGVRKALSFFGELGDYGNQVGQYANLTADNVYTPNYGRDLGNYDTNSGLFRPGRMGQMQYSQSGGAMDLDDEVEMTEEEIQEFLANGGEVEYL